ncbi:MAG: hypothetical protein II882_02465 [Lachnospiraceae bacterium]|nr:hypothetical protein [Lachnospiraceae bacterium]
MEEKKQEPIEEYWDPKKDAIVDEAPVDKSDEFAMWIAGIVTIAIPCLLLIGVIILVTLLIFTK